jgi:hypothetical protein
VYLASTLMKCTVSTSESIDLSGRMTGQESQRSDRCSDRVPASCKSEVISGLRRDVNEIFALLGCYAA